MKGLLDEDTEEDQSDFWFLFYVFGIFIFFINQHNIFLIVLLMNGTIEDNPIYSQFTL